MFEGNEGVFRALLAFRVDSGDTDLRDHLQMAGKNATMISKTIQNEIISTIGHIIRSKIAAKVQKSKYFSVLCDETTDASTTEQLTICIRYVDTEIDKSGRSHHISREDFVGFVPVADTTGANLKSKIVQELNNLGLSLSNLRGQGYDGASNMSGKFIGVQRLIMDEQPLAFYTHCFNHSLNLCVSKACEIAAVKNMVGIVASISAFLSGSAKRVLLLREIISQSNVSDQRKTKLKALCETRWVERHDCFQTFDNLLLYIAESLETLERDKDDKVSSKAAAYSAAIRRSDFLIALKVVNKVNSFTVSLSKTLQAPSLDISNAIEHVDNVIQALQDLRQAENAFQNVYQEAEETAEQLQVDIRIPRLCSRQKNRANIGFGTSTDERMPIDYYR